MSQNNDFNNEDYSLIFEDSSKDIQEKIVKTEKRSKVIALILSILLFASCAIGYTLFKGTKKLDYVGENVLRLAIGNGEASDTQTIANPWKESSLTTMLTFRSLFASNKTFVDVNEELASSCQELDGGLKYIITMKDTETWSDGTPITAEDVLFSFESFLLCEDVNYNMEKAFNLIKGANDWKDGKTSSLEGISINGNEITIELVEEYNLFDIMLTQFVPLPKHILKDIDPSTITSGIEFFENTNAVCSGMYMPTGFDEENNLILEKNPNYKEQQSDIEKILLCWDYKNQAIDYFSTTSVSDMASYRSVKELKEYPINVYSYHYFAYNTENGYTDENEKNQPIDNVLVRQAINHAVDLQKIFEDVYLGAGLRAYGGSMTMASKVYDYNQEKAIQLLNEANYDFNRPFTIGYVGDDTNTIVCLQKITQDLEKIGLKVELVNAKTQEELYQSKNFDMMHKVLTTFNIEGWYNEYLEADEGISTLYHVESQVEEKIHLLNNTVDGETYIKILGELVEIEQSLLYKMPMFVIDQAVFIDSTRVSLPDDMQFPNIEYRADIRFDEWKIKKDN